MRSAAVAGEGHGTSPIRVVVADDSYLVRVAVRHVLDVAEGIEVVAECGDRQTLEAAIESHAPARRRHRHQHAARRQRGGHPRSQPASRTTHPEIGVVVLSQYSEPGYVLRLLDAGSEGRAYLLKERIGDRAELVAAIRAVAEGGSVIDPKIVEVLVASHRRAERLSAAAR